MGYKLALSGVLVVSVIAGIGGLTGDRDLVNAEAEASSARASTANGRLATVARRAMNRFRARHRRHRLRYSPSLSRSARRQAIYMARHGFGHRSTVHASRAFRSVSEIILKHRGAHGDPGTAISGWGRSPAHRSIMLNGRYGSLGVAVVTRGGVTYWVAHVGRP